MKRSFGAMEVYYEEVEEDDAEDEAPTTVHVVLDDSPLGNTLVSTVGRRAKRKFCSNCVDYFISHYSHLFPEPPQHELLRLHIQNYLAALPIPVTLDYTSPAEVERVALHCMGQLQDEQGGKSSSSVAPQPGVLSVHDDLNTDDAVIFVPRPSSSSSLSGPKSALSAPHNSASSIMSEVLKIFPDAVPAFVTSLLDSHCCGPTTDLTSSSSSSSACSGPRYASDAFMKIVTTMSENGYDKVEKKKQAAVAAAAAADTSVLGSCSGSSGTTRVFSRDFSSTAWETDATYRAAAMMLLQNDFPFMKVASLQQFFAREGKHHYLPTVRALEHLLGAPRQLQYPIPAESARRTREALQQSAPALAAAKLKTKQTWRASPFLFSVGGGSLGGQPLGADLAEELECLRGQEQQRQEARDLAVAQQLNEELAEKEGSLLECGCCCGEYAFEALIQCSEGHLFCRWGRRGWLGECCKCLCDVWSDCRCVINPPLLCVRTACRTCLQKYIENTLFGSGKTRLSCMSSAAGEACTG
jgi:hypothetical protein